MATKKVLVELEVKQTGDAVPRVTREVDKLTAATKKLNYELSDEAKKVAEINVQTELQRKINRKLAVENIKLANSTEEVTESLNQMKTTAGLSGAIVTEFGRTVSDLPYGIRGVGNNLSQLGTLFGLFATNVKNSGRTMSDGFKELFGQMKGVIGIMTAFQIVLAAIQSEWFQNWIEGLGSVNSKLREFREELKELTSETEASAIVAREYINVIEDVSASEEERAVAVQELINLVPSLKEEDLEYGNNLDEVRKKVDEYVLSQVSRIEIDKLIQENSKLLLKQSKLQSIAEIDDLEKRSEAARKFLKEQGERTTRSRVTGMAVGMRGMIVKEYKLGTKELLDVFDNYSKEVDKRADPILERIGELRKGLLLESDKVDEESKRKQSRKTFKEGLLDLTKIRERYEQESKKSEVKTEEELIAQKAEFAKRDLELTLKNFEEKERIRLNDFIEKQKLRKKEKGVDVDAIDKSITEAKRQSSETIKAKRKESKYVIKQIEAVADAENTLLTRRRAERARAEKEQLERDELGRDIGLGSEGAFLSDELMTAQQARIQNEIDYQKRLLETTEEGSRERFEAEQAYYDSTMQKRDFELAYEQYVVDEKQRINREYISWVSGLSGILSSIAGENEGIQKAALAIDKGAAVAKVVVEANASIAKRIAANKAIPSLSPFAAALGVPKPNPAKLTDNLLMAKDVGRTKVSAGVAIANITAAGIGQASSIGGGGGGASGGGAGATTVQPPDFNIIGSTGVNQLAEAIGSTEKEPLRAYVVSSDITTKQALDRNIRSSAEL